MHTVFKTLLASDENRPVVPINAANILKADNSNSTTAQFKISSSGELELNDSYVKGSYVSSTSSTSTGTTTFTTLTDSNFINQYTTTGQNITYDSTTTPSTPYFLGSQQDWSSGFNTGKFKLKLVKGTAGSVKMQVRSDSNFGGGLSLRSIDTVDHNKAAVEAGIYGGTGKCSWLESGGENTGTVTLPTNGWLMLKSDGTTLKAYYSADNTTYTEYHTFTSINPATQDIYLGQFAHYGSKLYGASYTGFTAY